MKKQLSGASQLTIHSLASEVINNENRIQYINQRIYRLGFMPVTQQAKNETLQRLMKTLPSSN